MVINSIRDRFQQKDYIETLQTVEMPLLKVFCEEDFGPELQQISLFLSSDLDKFKLEIQANDKVNVLGIAWDIKSDYLVFSLRI